MNKTSRTDEPYKGDGHNQSPNALSNDMTTNQDLNGIANSRTRRVSNSRITTDSGQSIANAVPPDVDPDARFEKGEEDRMATMWQPPDAIGHSAEKKVNNRMLQNESQKVLSNPDPEPEPIGPDNKGPFRKVMDFFVTFGRFVGPGFMVSVAYIDPGNYATDIAAGSSYQFRLLFIVLMSNLFAIFLQSLSTKLGTITGLNLAEACRAFLPRWANVSLYLIAEAAIVATDMAEVIGTAIALNLLIPQLPLVWGCAISIVDVMLILIFYRPEGSMKGLRTFEIGVMCLVLVVFVCFCIQLAHIQNTTAGEVLKGYIPNDSITHKDGIYQACGILGATVMPHSLYLGSGLPQSRLKEYDEKNGLQPPPPPSTDEDDGKASGKTFYVPSLQAMKHCLKYSYAEQAISLLTFALFVNSAILIVAGASLYNNPDALAADLFGIHDLLSSSLGSAVGTVFALALLFSGVSAGIVCTISGQMICEGCLNWKIRPWIRRLLTRSVSILPSIVIAGAAGRDKLSDALEGSQVALSLALPFVSAPLIFFTCHNKYMTVQPGIARYFKEGKDSFGLSPVDVAARANSDEARSVEGGEQGTMAAVVRMANDWWVCVLAAAIWFIIVCMNIANLVLLFLPK